MLFNSFSEDILNFSGSANNHPVTVRALGYITVGHVKHHINIIKERYLVGVIEICLENFGKELHGLKVSLARQVKK